MSASSMVEPPTPACMDITMSSSQPEDGLAVLAPPSTPVRKSPRTGEPATFPRLRTSVSSHDRLISDDAACFTTLRHSNSIRRPESWVSVAMDDAPDIVSTEINLLDLPEEIQQRILDMLMGELQAPVPSISDTHRVLRNWNSVMRHPRSRKVADLSLVCDRWRRLIQGRIYRHIKLQGTIETIQETFEWFAQHPHLCPHVRHIEFWVPIWQRRGGPRDIEDPTSTTMIDMAVDVSDRNTPFGAARNSIQAVEPISASYCLSSQKSSLDELFDCVSILFTSACILTIEGGHCKRPPMIEMFRNHSTDRLSTLSKVRTLILRGAWNIMREPEHSQVVMNALPNLIEWHCAYTKPKAGGYRTMYHVIPYIPRTITRLNICLDGVYNQKNIATAKAQDIMREHHFCASLGSVLPQIEMLTLSGRFCSTLFNEAIQAAKRTRENRLKTVDIVIKNCCRELDSWCDGTGIHNWGFICAFGALVESATRALRFYPNLNFLRVRFVDLDAPCPLLNPYFQMQEDECAGIWNEEILANLSRARPQVSPIDLADSFGVRTPPKNAANYPTRRPRSIKMSSYATFSEGTLL